MNKTIFFVLILSMLFSFSFRLDAKEKKKIFIGKHERSIVTQKDGFEAAREKKWERYIRQRSLMEEKHAAASIDKAEMFTSDKPSAGDVTIDESYVYIRPDIVGNTIITGLCHNAGTTGASFVKVWFQPRDANGNILGEVNTYAFGGSSAQLSSSGVYTNVLEPGDYGFFRIYTSISNVDADKTKTAWLITWYNYSYTLAKAQLAFDGNVYGYSLYGNLDLAGSIKNSSSTYVAYDTYVAFAVFNTTETKVLDVSLDWVDGSTYGASDSAIYPGESAPFDVWFLDAPYGSTSNNFLYSFNYDEARISSLEEKDPPFGSFDTPIDGSTVSSSIAVTGWALDDSGIESVKIYRQQGNTLVFIGDAVLVEGARPDVAASYPQYPNNTKAGWGYMLLTNFLPNSGNGTFVLHAVATDAVGKSTTLGTKTITCDNANAVKPFGAIDTPTQGGSASGSGFVNWGWVLTPQPNSIPTNGSTINVWVDGVNIGNPTYNIYRSDIADFFPGYANSDGAAGFFKMDTTSFANGVHTIQWTARDSGGNSDGIGSRYFSINNSGSNSMVLAQRVGEEEVSQLPEDDSMPIRVKQGFKADTPQEVPRDENGMNRIVIKELGRIEVYLSNQPSNNYSYSGYMKMGRRLMALPVGSTLDAKRGIFYWQPGPGFLGRYHLVFVEASANGTMMKKNIIVEIVPKTAAADIYAR